MQSHHTVHHRQRTLVAAGLMAVGASAFLWVTQTHARDDASVILYWLLAAGVFAAGLFAVIGEAPLARYATLTVAVLAVAIASTLSGRLLGDLTAFALVFLVAPATVIAGAIDLYRIEHPHHEASPEPVRVRLTNRAHSPR